MRPNRKGIHLEPNANPVSTQYTSVTDGQTDGHMTSANTVLCTTSGDSQVKTDYETQ